MNEQLLTVKCCHVFFGGVMHLLKASLLCTLCFDVLDVLVSLFARSSVCVTVRAARDET